MSAETESDVVNRLVPDLQAEGYEVYLNPAPHLLPEFLRNYQPDIIGRRSDHNVAIEITRISPHAEKKLEDIANRFKGQTAWEFRVVWINPASASTVLQAQTVAAIRKQIAEIRALMDGEHYGAALLLAWSALEATSRTLASQKFERPQTPGRLIQVLANDGYLTPTEADRMRPLSDKRNKLIHGELQTQVTRREIEQFAEILTALVKMIGK